MIASTYTHHEACQILDSFFPDADMTAIFEQMSIHRLRIGFRQKGLKMKVAADKFYFEKINIYNEN